RGAAWLGGWGAVTVAGGAAGLLSQVHLHHTIYDGRVFGVSYTDMLVTALQSGTTFGLLTGWAVGLAAALACRPQPVPAWSGSAPPPSAVGAPPPPPPGPTRVSEPPPPWWAPTGAVADGSVRPGPTAYPPGGLRPGPPDATHAMPPASRDPRPAAPAGVGARRRRGRRQLPPRPAGLPARGAAAGRAGGALRGAGRLRRAAPVRPRRHAGRGPGRPHPGRGRCTGGGTGGRRPHAGRGRGSRVGPRGGGPGRRAVRRAVRRPLTAGARRSAGRRPGPPQPARHG